MDEIEKLQRDILDYSRKAEDLGKEKDLLIDRVRSFFELEVLPFLTERFPEDYSFGDVSIPESKDAGVSVATDLAISSTLNYKGKRILGSRVTEASDLIKSLEPELDSLVEKAGLKYIWVAVHSETIG